MSLPERKVRGGIIATIIVVIAGLVCVSPVLAQQSEEGGRILHRYFDVEQWRPAPSPPAAPGDSATSQGVPGSSGEAQQVRRPDTEAGEAPGLWLSPGDDEWILSPDGPMGPSDIDAPHGGLGEDSGTTELDGATDQVDDLDYQSNFEPSVVPLKRGVAQNRSGGGDGGTPITYLESGEHRSVDVGGAAGADEDLFWGTFLVRLEESRPMRIPSVGPEQRVLEVLTEPRIDIEITRDEADNFYVASAEPGLVRINMRVAVARHYFDGALDAGVGWDAFVPGAGMNDDYLQNEAEGVFEMIGIVRDEQTPLEALERLVEYHRQFEMREAPELQGIDRYVELTRMQLGVCRHRALVFTITAKALGFETRYVYNEAHAFVEVYWPGQGWRRIDLGGAADTFNYQARGGSSVHDGVWDDAFPRPESYEAEMSAMGGEDADGGDTSVDAAAGAESGEGEDLMDQVRDELALEEDTQDASPKNNDVDPTPTVELLEAQGEVYRGREITVRGRVEPPRQGASVQVVLVPVGASDTATGIPVGEATAATNGHFEVRGTVPDDISLGRWRLSGRLTDEVE